MINNNSIKYYELVTLPVLFIITFCFSFTHETYGSTNEELCTGSLVEISNLLCRCKATDRLFNAAVEPQEIGICEFTTALKSQCQDPDGFLAYQYPDRCLCRLRRTYLTPTYVIEDFAGARHLKNMTPHNTHSRTFLRVNATQLREQLSGDRDLCIRTSLSLLEHQKSGHHQLPGSKTIHINQLVPGHHGGMRYQMNRRKGMTIWTDWSDYPNPQGVPFFAIHALGPTLGRYFGFEPISPRIIQIPDVKEVQNAIIKLNQKIIETTWAELTPHELINIEFYDASEGTVKTQSYLENFANHRKLPIGSYYDQAGQIEKDQTTLLHDSHFHIAGTILTPPEYIEAGRQKTELLLNFENYVRTALPRFKNHPHLKLMFSRMNTARLHQIDIGSAAGLRGAGAYDDSREKQKYNIFIKTYALLGNFDKTYGTVKILSNAEFLYSWINHFDRYIEDHKLNGEIHSTVSDFLAITPSTQTLTIEITQDELYDRFMTWHRFLTETARSIPLNTRPLWPQPKLTEDDLNELLDEPFLFNFFLAQKSEMLLSPELVNASRSNIAHLIAEKGYPTPPLNTLARTCPELFQRKNSKGDTPLHVLVKRTPQELAREFLLIDFIAPHLSNFRKSIDNSLIELVSTRGFHHLHEFLEVMR